MAFGQTAPYSLEMGPVNMQRAMLFIDFENFDIAKYSYYKKKCLEDAEAEAALHGLPRPHTVPVTIPRLDFNELPRRIVSLLPEAHVLVKSFLFAPKPDSFLMQDHRRASTYNWINGLKNQKYFTVVEGTHSARPVSGYSYNTMDITNPSSYYVEEKGTDINLATHLITKGFMNTYDTAVIMSGDTDYIPVLDVLNTLGKTTVIVGVQGQNLFQFTHHSDDQIWIDDALFQTCLR